MISATAAFGFSNIPSAARMLPCFYPDVLMDFGKRA